LISAPPVEVAAAINNAPLFFLQDGAEKEFRLALDDITKLFDAERDKGHLTYNDVNDPIPHDVHSPEDLDDLLTTGSQPIRTAFRSPWQNGIAERWVGSVRRDLLDHVIVLNRKHLRRLLNEYVHYYHEDRTHLGLGKDTPGGRVAAPAPLSGHNVISLPRLGGLHHRYTVAA
jgi:hypothetical protein